jgi:signal transduction histidine kinase
MAHLPSPVQDYLEELTLNSRAPAYLLVDKAGDLRICGGMLSAYGIGPLQQGTLISEQVDFLEGLLPLDDSPLFLPCIETASGLFADLHLFPTEQGDWVVMLDAGESAAQRRLLQQKAHDLSLLRQRQIRQVEQFGGADSAQYLLQFAYGAMMMHEALLADLFATLAIVVMERLPDGAFRTISSVPEWLMRVYPEAASGEGFRPRQTSPFLENFLIDAEQLWRNHRAGHIRSGPWRETDSAGQDCYLEAAAVCLGDRKLLLIAFPKVDYEEKQAIIQKAREHKLEADRFGKDMQQKEILLHCIVHDLAGPLTPILMCFSLLGGESLSPAGRHHIAVGMQQAARQQAMIQQILDVFAAEIGGLDLGPQDSELAPDVVTCVRGVVEALVPVATMKQMVLRLDAPRGGAEPWRVVGDTPRLERVVFNLVENALRHGPQGSLVTVSIQRDASETLITVVDQGSGVPPDSVPSIFEKFARGPGNSGRAGLGLYFCRMTVERWGGTIGYSPRPEGGSRFWIRLPVPLPRPLP